MKINLQSNHLSGDGQLRSQGQRALLFSLVFSVAAVAGAGGDLAAKAARNVVVEVGPPVTPYVFDGDLRDLPPAQEWLPGDPIKYVPRRFYPKDSPPTPVLQDWPDPLVHLQTQVDANNTRRAFDVPILSFAGQGFSGVYPPDPVGEIGPNHYIQGINGNSGGLIRVYDKTTGAPLTGAIAISSLGLGGDCAIGLGDPIILYDEAADRWMVTEFADIVNALCVYISRTNDPVAGGWYRYQFDTPNFPDYPKYGVWWNAYYVTTNEGVPPIYAMDRARMLTGAAATSQRFTVPGLPGFGFEALTPADHDGPNQPPANAPAYFGRHRDDEVHDGASTPTTDFIQLWSMVIDWVTPANSVLTALPNITIADFSSDLCGLSTFSCITQPGGGRPLDPLREVLMWRLQYRNQGTHESLVGNLATNMRHATIPNLVGVRWFELRKVGAGPWTLQNQGTYGPDFTQPNPSHRWMGSAAMDSAGNIALAYSTTNPNTSLFPSLSYTGRLATDAQGVMSQPETRIVTGAAAQAIERWGDYASLNVDPSDDCTFWYTNEYSPTTTWGTHIASFKFCSCGCVSFPAVPGGVTATPNGNNRANIGWNDSTSASVGNYLLSRSTTPGGPYTQIADIVDTSPGVGGGAPYVYPDTGLSGGTTYYYVVEAVDTRCCPSGRSTQVSVLATGPCLLAPTFAGLTSIGSPPNCTLVLGWPAATTNCTGGAISYDIHRSTTAGFVPSAANRIATGVTVLSYIDSAVTAGTPYFYIVRAIDSSGGQNDGNIVDLSSSPGGADVGPTNYVGTGGGQPILDLSTLAVTANVTGSGPLRAVRVNVALDHAWIGDVGIILEAPDATQVVLLDRPLFPANLFGCGDENMNVTFDGTSTFNLEPHCIGTNPWYNGVAAPFQAFTSMLGTSINGTWRLLIQDNAGQDEGVFTSWSLDLTYGGPCGGGCSTAAFTRNRGLKATKDTSPTRAGIRFDWPADTASPPFYHVNLVNNDPIMLETPGPQSTAAGVIRCAVAALTCNDAAPPVPVWNGVLFYQVLSACNMNVGNEGPW